MFVFLKINLVSFAGNKLTQNGRCLKNVHQRHYLLTKINDPFIIYDLQRMSQVQIK